MNPRRPLAHLPTALLAATLSTAQPATNLWPVAGREARPWAYHWWPGSAVDEVNLRRELARHREAGLGGVHIIPVYGARGAEDRFVPFLSDRWLELFAFTVREAEQLDLGVDLTTGTGWCFGGPAVRPEHGGLRWSVRNGRIEITPTNLKVKRSAPGGEGLMINPFSPAAMREYLSDWSRRFVPPGGVMPRALYHDSYEYYGCTWAPELPAAWRRRCGYAPEEVIEALAGAGPSERVARVAADYRATLSDLAVEEVITQWTSLCRAQGLRTRLQAHGAAANLLDLYALADIPETEMFGRGDRDPLRSGFDERFGEGDRDPLVAKFASSAAHLADRPLVSAETGTWIAEHFCETFEELRCLADLLFASGVNHIFWHGCVYSPDDAPWPGWLFYAATQMNPRNPLWREAATLHACLTRTQSVLQQGRPEADLLLYWPVDDLFMTPPDPGRSVAPLWLGVHQRDWLHGQRVGAVARELWRRGIAFDYVSERGLARLRPAPATGTLATAGGTQWRALLVPATRYLPPTAAARLLDLAADGATVLWETPLPQDVPGLGQLEDRRRQLVELRARLDQAPIAPSPTSGAVTRAVGRGRVITGPLDVLLRAAPIFIPSVGAGEGLQSVRRRVSDGRWLWFAWHGHAPFDREIALPPPVAVACVLDPLTGESGITECRSDPDGVLWLRLRIEPGHSVIVRTWDRGADAPSSAPRWQWLEPDRLLAEPMGWHVRFVSGGPTIPPPFETASAAPWTGRGDEAADAFAGTALYATLFDLQGLERQAPTASNAWTGADRAAVLLDLGDVRHIARVRLNGRDLGARFQRPYRWTLPADLLRPAQNALEIEVTNLAANRIRDLDRRGVRWKNFHDINFVNIRYRPFDASQWPVQTSGLLGPVRLWLARETPASNAR
ncbi:MAG: glycosyl hydrolase [Kiritimatiellae bacterium]|nr:glycosyl hydrolase [Kiritimatiellia bacterium]